MPLHSQQAASARCMCVCAGQGTYTHIRAFILHIPPVQGFCSQLANEPRGKLKLLSWRCNYLVERLARAGRSVWTASVFTRIFTRGASSEASSAVLSSRIEESDWS